MTILVRNEGDKTGGAGKLDYCGVLSWDLFLPTACGIYVETGDAFTRSKALPDQTCPGLSLGKKVFEVNRKITHLNDVFYWHWQCFDSLTDSFFFFFKFWRVVTWGDFIHIPFGKQILKLTRLVLWRPGEWALCRSRSWDCSGSLV